VGVAVSSSHIVSAAPSSSGGGLLTLCPCSRVRSLSWETVFHELLQCGPLPQAAVLQELLQRGSLPQGAVLQEQTAVAWVPHGVRSPASKPAPAWAPLTSGTQVLPGACSSMGSPWGHSLLRASTCSSVGSSPGCRWRSAPPWTSTGCRGTACPTMVCSMGCRGTSALAPGEPPLAPSSLTLVSAELFLSHILTPLFWLLLHSSFFPLFQYIIPEALPPSLMGSALASSGSVLDPAGIGSIRHRGSFQQLLTAATPTAPSYQNLAVQTQYSVQPFK